MDRRAENEIFICVEVFVRTTTQNFQWEIIIT